MHSHAFTSALGLLRLQYEALVRAHWLVFAASDTQVEKLLAELTHESAKAGNSIPMVEEMWKVKPLQMLFSLCKNSKRTPIKH
ncbi:hypothetical protein AYI83_04855 [Shewanella algae]|nr:hypothetical protein AYI83_04855 [Shewanella algae]